MIEITNVTRRFGRSRAVDGVSIEIKQGDSLALWGTNGAGKTTLIRCVIGQIGFEGNITVGGFSVKRRGKSARQLIGYVPQELSFYDELLVNESVRFFGQLKGIRGLRPREVLTKVGLEDHERKRVRQLSGGMKQRLALAIALLGDPPVLVLDEVTASLDVCGRSEFMTLLTGLGGSGRTMLFASHRLDEVSSLAKNVAVLAGGRLEWQGPVRDFVTRVSTGGALHLVIPASARTDAIDRLRAEGFVPALNGVGIIVPVSPEHKAAPLRVLADARIPVDDFDVISGDVSASMRRERSEK